MQAPDQKTIDRAVWAIAIEQAEGLLDGSTKDLAECLVDGIGAINEMSITELHNEMCWSICDNHEEGTCNQTFEWLVEQMEEKI